ncbi:hypothetical protein XENOCAPTIV_022026 [Xenoophorus captivus]|uniref:Ig-like domain-containing protein n=1 Tax=Xenoophorus captivus TaxID=1517983 RepID=A0ABV0R4C9_9TELE
MVRQTLLTSPSSSIQDKNSFILAPIGGEVTLRCSYEGDESVWICWYMQTLGQKPQLISSFYVYSKESIFYGEFKKHSRFSLIRENRTTNQLIISDLKISDSATYYCAFSHAQAVSFSEGVTVIIKGSSYNIQALVYQSESKTIQPGDSVTLICTVQTGTCDGEHSAYWFRNSVESHPVLIYSHGGKNDQCERNPNIQTHTCVYTMPIKNLNVSDAGTYYCAVTSCGHIVFGNGTTLTFTSEGNLLVYFMAGSLIGLVLVLLMFFVYTLNTSYQAPEPRFPDPTTHRRTVQGTSQVTDSLDFASVDVKTSNSPRTKKSSN